MKREKILSLFLVVAFLAPVFFPLGQSSYECYVFYDATSTTESSIMIGLEMLQTVCDEKIPLKLVPVDSRTDFYQHGNAMGAAIFLFHGSEQGLTLSSQDDTFFSWLELADFIDGTCFSEYFVLSCDSTVIDEMVEKERVLTFVGNVDAKIAVAIALHKIDSIIRHYSQRISFRVFQNLLTAISEDLQFFSRFFTPIDPLGLEPIGEETTTQYGLLVSTLEELRDSVHAQARLIISEKSYQYVVSLAFEAIMNLLTGHMYAIMKDAAEYVGAIWQDLEDVITDVINGDISASSFESAIAAVIDLWHLTEIAREMITSEKARYILQWVDLPAFVASFIYTYATLKAQVEDDDYGERNIYSDSLAIAMDDEQYRDIPGVLFVPQTTSIVNALDDLISVLKGAFNYDTIRSKASTVVSTCDTALSIVTYIGGDTEDYTELLLKSVKAAAKSIYDSGAYYLDRYADDNYYYEMDWSVSADWWTSKLNIAYSFRNPTSNQVPIYSIWTRFTETRAGSSRESLMTYYYYLLPGETFSDSFKLSYDGWKGWSVSYEWNLEIRHWVDLYGSYKSSTDSDGDGMSDYQELWSVFGYRTSPTLADTDRDGYRDKYEIDHGWNPLDPSSPNSGGGSGCPILFVYDGSTYHEEGLLDIHDADGNDITLSHELSCMPGRVGLRYWLRLEEHQLTISHIDQVKLYARLRNGWIVQCPLMLAEHSALGDVTQELRTSDDIRVDEIGAKFNNGTSESIHLEFFSFPGLPVESFFFVIEGNNVVLK
ncbi:MAG: hypothetical protein ACFFED_13850 [Candidatus Thorarchaeota archaeon]